MALPFSMLLRGLAIGFSIAAPVGPIGILCIRRTLANGRLSGLASGLGAATADASYGCIAGFGLTFISDLLINQQTLLRVVGGLFLCYLGARTFLAKPADRVESTEDRGLSRAYVSTFFLTLTNPLTILSFAAIFAGLGLAESGGSYATAGVLVLGVFTGSALWWLFLTLGIGTIRGKVGPAWLRWVNRISGTAIAAFGVAALISAA